MNDENTIDENVENDEQDIDETIESPDEELDSDTSVTTDQELELAKAEATSAKDDYVRLQAEMQNLSLIHI